MLAVLVGLVEIGLGLVKLGFVADLLSKEVQVGYMNGLAITNSQTNPARRRSHETGSAPGVARCCSLSAKLKSAVRNQTILSAVKGADCPSWYV